MMHVELLSVSEWLTIVGPPLGRRGQGRRRSRSCHRYQGWGLNPIVRRCAGESPHEAEKEAWELAPGQNFSKANRLSLPRTLSRLNMHHILLNAPLQSIRSIMEKPSRIPLTQTA